MTPEGQRILVNAPFGRDADSVASLLREQNYSVVVCRDLIEVASLINDEIGAVLLTEEALIEHVDALKTALELQPSWSDVPFVLLAAPRSSRMPNVRLSQLALFDLASNSVVLERPLGKASLFSAVASAMRLRQKQFQMRDGLAELNDSETRLRLATSAAGIGTWDFEPATGRLSWDKRCRSMFGIQSDMEVTYEGAFLAGMHPDDRQRADDAVKAALEPTGRGEYDIEYRTIGIEDGAERWIAAKGGAIFVDGVPVRFIGTVIDISERKRTEKALATSEAALRAERQALDELNRTLEERVVERTAELEEEMSARGRAEDALRQAQKMEAVGQLTGGIAHDFNNMLTGIIGGINIAKRRIASGRLEEVDRFMDAATDSANRAAALIVRLLAFSRRQTLDAKQLDVAAQLNATKELLERTLPETIIVEIVVDAAVGSVVADVNQLESALLNLAINARDAMPDGGHLTITGTRHEVGPSDKASGLEPGRYIVIAVKDTGGGMPAEILDKVFEPFFTTKPIGQGTGLGLSMIYGFAQQSGGQVRIHSAPGQGTRIELYLPASEGEEKEEAESSAHPTPEGQGQTVLVVEDDDAVRLLICDVLTELSYCALEASAAGGAIPILSGDQPIDLMISDVGLPGMNGRQLADVARQHRPDIPILFVTGYAENATTKASFLGTNMAMISKPFAVDTLAAKISEMVTTEPHR
ncbi:hybrid sensor histidine kinase/response regulator [Rhizobium sp. Root708]|uniref:hybrid sensor histidine kinase/response regulator n=1 Tax=Rhizobium sp. Root708 TaxID=1736592 RepID=UPI000AE54208|nr:ATP-binding protein [Rhizobium sp. Root708]